MRFGITKKGGVVVTLAAAVLVVGGAWLAFGRDNNNKPATTIAPVTGQTTPSPLATKGPDPAKLVPIEAADFKYDKPIGWAQMAQKVLDSSGASSGIARPSAPVATFTVKVNSAIPKDANDLKSSTLTELKKFSHFSLISSANTKVDGKSGQKFIYSFSDINDENKVTQNMSVVVNKQKTFFLLFSSAAADYDKQTGDFDAILSSFKFK